MSAVAAAIATVGTAVIGGIASNSAAKKAASAQNKATAAATDISKEQLALDRERFDFERDQWDAGAADREYASDMARQVGDRQLQSMDQQYRIADDYWDYQKETFRPLEIGLVNQASEYDTAARRESAADAAAADVNAAFSNTQGQNLRLAGRYGLNGGRFASIANANAIAQASALAGAKNKARNDVETKGFAMKMDASGLGRNLPGNQTAAVTSAMSQGNSGVNNSLVPINVANNATAAMSNAYGNMSSGLNGFASRTLDIGNIQANNFYNSQRFGMTVGNNTADALMTGYGLASGRYTPPGWK